MDYILATKKPGCFLCDLIAEDRERENLVLRREEHTLTLMNRYPYNNGHLMVAPYRHIDSIEALTPEEQLEMMQAVAFATRVLRGLIKADGFNIGINLGKAAGAGLEEHLHVHIVPRWNGDTNFMPVLTNTKVMPQALYELYDLLLPAFQDRS